MEPVTINQKSFENFLAEVNKDLPASEWKITCEKFAPNDPDQNPVEDVWLQAKNFLRKYWRLCRSFKAVKWLFMFFYSRTDIQLLQAE